MTAPVGRHSISGLDRGDKPFLGDPAVVRKVLKDMLMELNEADSSEEAITRAADILVGDDEAYEPISFDWSMNGLGRWIRSEMNNPPDPSRGTRHAVEWALGHLCLHFLEARKMVGDGHWEAEAAGKRMRFLVGNWTNMMLGIPGAWIENTSLEEGRD